MLPKNLENVYGRLAAFRVPNWLMPLPVTCRPSSPREGYGQTGRTQDSLPPCAYVTLATLRENEPFSYLIVVSRLRSAAANRSKWVHIANGKSELLRYSVE